MPNGTYGGVKGARSQPLFDCSNFRRKRGIRPMKNIEEKISMAEEIKQLQNERKKPLSKQKLQERKKRDRRIYEKGAVF